MLTTGRVINDLRILALAIVAGVAAVDPTWALRTGAVVAAAVLATNLPAIRLGVTEGLLIGLVGLCWASLWWTVNESVTELTALNALAALVLFVTYRTIIRTARAMRTVVLGVLAGCVYTVVTVLTTDEATFRLRFDTSTLRGTVEGVNPNYLAYTYATAGALIVLSWVCTRPGAAERVALLVLSLAMWAGIVQSGTRGAFVSAVVLVAWLVWQRLRPGRGLRALWWVGAVLNVLIVTGWLDGRVQSSVGVSGCSGWCCSAECSGRR